MNHKNRLQIVTSFLAICASVVSACVCVLLISGEYHSAQFNLDTNERELQGWQACRQTNPDYFKANEQAFNSCLASIDLVRDNFWVKLPKTHLIGLFVLAALVSASGGYIITWAVLWFISFGIFKFIRFFVFYRKFSSSKELQNKYNLHSFATKP